MEQNFHLTKLIPVLKEGDTVSINGIDGKIMAFQVIDGSDFCLVELSKPDAYGCTIISVRKPLFDFLIYK